jgi:hypothetical protein
MSKSYLFSVIVAALVLVSVYERVDSGVSDFCSFEKYKREYQKEYAGSG